jgi:putative LysE/RhtB family amino acid efflux pump
MSALAVATVFAAGFLIMTPVGPVSTICIRRALLHGSRAGIAAGAGDALAVAVYASIGVAGSDLLPRFFAPYAKVWHVGIALVLVLVAIVMWRSRPLLPKVRSSDRTTLATGFGATLAIALANPADIVLFGALFAGLGIALSTPQEHVLFAITIFAGGCAYWIALALFLARWREALTAGRIVWLNRASAALMVAAASASLISLAQTRS